MYGRYIGSSIASCHKSRIMNVECTDEADARKAQMYIMRNTNKLRDNAERQVRHLLLNCTINNCQCVGYGVNFWACQVCEEPVVEHACSILV